MKKQLLPLTGPPATAVFATPTAGTAAIGHALSLPPHRAVLLVIGAAGNLNPELRPQLAQLFDAVARVAHDTGALLLDGGTQAGVMALLGEAVARQPQRPPLLGVAPAALVSYPGSPATSAPLEPHHSHFVLVAGTEWGDETATLFALTAALATSPTGPLPAAVLLAGGGGIARNEMVQATRQGLPVVVISGTGGLADELAAHWPTRQTPPEEPRLAEILATRNLQFFPIAGAAADLSQALRQLLEAKV